MRLIPTGLLSRGGSGAPVVTFQPEGGLDETVSGLKEQGVEFPAGIS